MGLSESYIKENEELFRKVLRIIKPIFGIVPRELDPESPLDEILKKYAFHSESKPGFCIVDFVKGPEDGELFTSKYNLKEEAIIIEIADYSAGCGYAIKFDIINRKSVAYQSIIHRWVS